MNYWIFPCDVKQYDVHGAFQNFNKVQWIQNIKRIEVGDIILIYITKPSASIELACEVVDSGIDSDERKYEDADYINDTSLEQKLKNKKFLIIKKLANINITLEDMKINGLTGGMQFQRQCQEPLLSYIKNRLKSQ